MAMKSGLLIAALSAASIASADVCNPLDFGAVGDGAHDDTDGVQAAMDACIGGGTVHVSAGTYLIRPVRFNGNGIIVQLDSGATLQGTPNRDDYGSSSNLILADGKADLALIGDGTIDGSGSAFWGQDPRPRLVRFRRSQRVLVQGLTFQNSPSFHLVVDAVSDVTIDRVTILAPPDSPNTDGIDAGGTNINISNCYIDTGDDNIAIKAGTGSHTDGVTIHDCTFLHGHGLSMGSELNDGVVNFAAQNITFEGTQNGLRIKSDRTRGGVVRNVSYDSISMNNVGRIIDIAGYYPELSIPAPGTDPGQPLTDTTPQYSSIRVSNLTSVGGGRLAPNGAFFIGVPEAQIASVVLQNVDISGASRPFELRNVEVQRCNVSVNAGFVIDENVNLIDGGCGDDDYALSLSADSGAVVKGDSTAFVLTVTATGGFDGPVSFTASGLPGVTTSFDPQTVEGGGTTTLTIATSSLTPVGDFPLTITGTSAGSGALSRIAVTTLTVLGDAPLFCTRRR